MPHDRRCSNKIHSQTYFKPEISFTVMQLFKISKFDLFSKHFWFKASMFHQDHI